MVTVAAIVILCLAWLGVRGIALQSRSSHVPGVFSGRLADCPDRPNCVSSQSTAPGQRMEPIRWEKSAQEASKLLDSMVRSMPRTRVVTVTRDYLHVEFRSWLFGFVDDMEFWIDESANQIHFRSSSRSGYSDLGVNRKRMEQIRQELERGRTS